MSSARNVVSSAKLIAICTLMSRITGLVRDILLAQAFGLGWVQDAFSYAFQFPNLFRRLFGEGAMAPVFVPTFTQTLERDGPQAAWALLARTLALLTATLSALIIVIAGVIATIWHFFPASPETQAARELLLSLTAMMLPFILTICVLALLSSILNCVGSFVPAALAPVLLNIAMIIAVAGIGPALYPNTPSRQVHVVAMAVVLAGVLQILLMVPVLRRHGVRLGWRWDPGEPTVRRMLRLLPPVALGQGVLAFGVFLDAQICTLLTHVEGTPESVSIFGWTLAYPLDEGALSAVTYATRLYQFPLGVLVISLATAALPMFSRLAAREDWTAWSGEVRQALRLAIFEGLLAGTMMILLARPIVRLLFEYGNFTAAHTDRASAVLMFYGFALWAFCAQHIVSRAFYSLGDVRTPLKIVAGLLPLNVLINLSLVWVPQVRESAFAIGSGVTSTLSVAIGVWMLRRTTASPIVDRRVGMAIVRMLLAALAAAAALWTITPWIMNAAEQIDVQILRRAVETFGLLAAGSVTYLTVAWVLRLPEVGMLLPGRLRSSGA